MGGLSGVNPHQPGEVSRGAVPYVTGPWRTTRLPGKRCHLTNFRCHLTMGAVLPDDNAVIGTDPQNKGSER